MIRPIIKDPFFLGQNSEDAVKEDLPIGQDLQDTLYAHRDRCVGMAANMIGVRKKIIIVSMGNGCHSDVQSPPPKKDIPYEAEEGCLFAYRYEEDGPLSEH